MTDLKPADLGVVADEYGEMVLDCPACPWQEQHLVDTSLAALIKLAEAHVREAHQ